MPRKLRTPAAVGLLLAASLGIELFVGNLNWLATHSYTPVDLRPYLVNDADPAAPLTLNDEQTTLEFAGLDFAIYNLQLDGLTSLADGDTPEQKNVLLTFNVAATDEASSVSRQSWNWEAAPASARSQTHSLDLSGKASTLTLTALGYTGEYRSYPLNAQLTTVYANARRPLDFSVLRFAVIFALALAAFALRPASAAWQDAYLTHEKKYRPAVLAVGLALCAAAFLAPFGDRFNAGVATSFYNAPDWSGTSRIDFTMHINDWASNAGAQYGALAHSLLNGRLDLEKDPPAAMAELENPYDTAARQAAAPDALWDVAYYNGRYYVYFGIVPCLLFQLPFEALTGIRDLPPALPMILLAWLYILAVFGFVKQAARRWFPQASAAAYLLTAAGAALLSRYSRSGSGTVFSYRAFSASSKCSCTEECSLRSENSSAPSFSSSKAMVTVAFFMCVSSFYMLFLAFLCYRGYYYPLAVVRGFNYPRAGFSDGQKRPFQSPFCLPLFALHLRSEAVRSLSMILEWCSQLPVRCGTPSRACNPPVCHAPVLPASDAVSCCGCKYRRSFLPH